MNPCAHVGIMKLLCYVMLLLGLTLCPGGAGERMIVGYSWGKILMLTWFFLCSVKY